MWFFGDEFVSGSFTEHLRHARNSTTKEPCYTIQNFEVKDYATTRYASSIRNILGRFRGLLIKAIKEEKYLPKLMVFVPDADIITQTGVTGEEGIAEMMGYLL